MTVVIADTSPLHYLVLIGQVEILRCLYNKVLVPPEVLTELRDSSAPSPVLDWIHSKPEWLEVRAITRDPNEAALQHIGPGERAAILLAQQEADALLLIDDAAGRAEADRRRIRCTATLRNTEDRSPASTPGSSECTHPPRADELPGFSLSN